MKLMTVLAVALLAASSPLAAHEVLQGPNGGRVVEVGRYHVELVVKEYAVSVFLSDEDSKPLAVGGFKGTAILVVADKSHRVVLQPAEGQRLAGTSTIKLPGSPKGVVQLTSPDGKTAQGRYR